MTMLTAPQVLDNYYLDARCMLLEIAATLDRFDRAAGSDEDACHDPRLDRLYEALQVLADRTAPPDRSERLLLLFSDPD